MASKLLEKYVKSLIINRTYPKDPANFDRNYSYHNDQYNFTNKDYVHIAIWFEENIDKNRLDCSQEWYTDNLPKRKLIIKLLFKIYSEEYPDLPKKNLTNLKKLLKNMLKVTQLAILQKANKKTIHHELYNGIKKIFYKGQTQKVKKKKGKTVKQLKAECKKRGIKRYSKLRKQQLLDLLNF